MAGRVGNDELAFFSREITVGHINGNALLAFGLQAIYQQGKVCGTTLQMPAEAWPATRDEFTTYRDDQVSRIEISDESVDLAWWPLDALPGETDDDMRALIDFGVAACRNR